MAIEILIVGSLSHATLVHEQRVLRPAYDAMIEFAARPNQ